MTTQLAPFKDIESRIHFIRGQKVMLSLDLARLYGVEPRALVQAVKRNRERFPVDFAFQLGLEEFHNLKSQIVISSWGGMRRALPYAFTEHGVAMLSTVLHSPQAIQVNIAIMRAFVRMRQVLSKNKDLAKRIEKLEKKVDLHDTDIRLLIHDVRNLLSQPEPSFPLHPIHKIKGFEKS